MCYLMSIVSQQGLTTGTESRPAMFGRVRSGEGWGGVNAVESCQNRLTPEATSRNQSQNRSLASGSVSRRNTAFIHTCASPNVEGMTFPRQHMFYL